jgi:hypothetical protein
MFQHGDLVLRQKLLDSALCAGELSWWRIHEPLFHMSFSSQPFTKGCQNLLIVNLVKGLTFKQWLLPHCWPYGHGNGEVDEGERTG